VALVSIEKSGNRHQEKLNYYNCRWMNKRKVRVCHYKDAYPDLFIFYSSIDYGELYGI